MSRGSLLVAPLFALLVGCGPGGASVRVRLEPDPVRQSEETVAQALASLVFVLDLAQPGVELDGLPPGEGAGQSQYLDLDEDGAREPVFTYEWAGHERLPLVGLTAIRNQNRPVILRAEGRAEEELVAIGGVSSVVVGQQSEATAPFNLLPTRLPVRVVASQPEADQLIPELADFSVTFSRRVRLDTVTPDTVYLRCPGAVPPEWRPKTIYATEQQFERPRIVRHRIRGVLESRPGLRSSCAIVVHSAVLADDGTPLDQDATVPGSDGFVSGTFSVVYQDPSSTLRWSCRVAAGQPGDFECPARAGVTCSLQTGQCEVIPGCGVCAAGYLCDPEAGACLEDCRRFGACLDPRRRCDESGLCSSL